MPSAIDINCHKNMTAAEILEEIRYPLENLNNFLGLMSKLRVDDSLTDDDLTSFINTLHHQVDQINKVINPR